MKAIYESVNKTWSLVLCIIFAVIALMGILLCLVKRTTITGGVWTFLGLVLTVGGGFSSGLFLCSYLDHTAG